MMRAEAQDQIRPTIPFPIPENMLRMVEEQVSKQPAARATFYKAGGEWKSHSWTALWNELRSVGAALLEEGVQSGDRVAILSATRVEHAVADFGILAGLHGFSTLLIIVLGDETLYDRGNPQQKQTGLLGRLKLLIGIAGYKAHGRPSPTGPRTRGAP